MVSKSFRYRSAFRVIVGKAIPHEDSSLSLIISAQAAHWFDLPYFYNEAKRTLKDNGVLAVFGYAFVQAHGQHADKLNKILEQVITSPTNE